MVVVQVDGATGALLADPEFQARGVAGLDGREAELGFEVRRALEELAGDTRANGAAAWRAARVEAVRVAARRWFRRANGRRPLVEPVVVVR